MADEEEGVGFHQEMTPQEEKRRSGADLFRRGSAAEKVQRSERRRSTFSEASLGGSSSSGPDGGLVWRREPDKVSRIPTPRLPPSPLLPSLYLCFMQRLATSTSVRSQKGNEGGEEEEANRRLPGVSEEIGN